MYIERAIEPVLRERFRTSKAVAVTGARQVGKTTLTKHAYPSVQRINMKDERLLRLAADDPVLFLRNFNRPLFIDEVQAAPFLLQAVKVLLDEEPEKTSYLFSGSQKWELMKGLSESLAGMVSILELSGLSMREIHNIPVNLPFSLREEYLQEREKSLVKYGDVWRYIHRGFYPELYEEDSREWTAFYRDYLNTYLERDVYQILKIRDQRAFYRFLVAVAARTGNILNYSSLADEAGVDSVTVKTWISVLERTGIICILQPYLSSHLTRAIKSPKVYFRDTGLAAYLTNWTTEAQLRDGAMGGAFFETFVVNEIIKSYTNAGKDYGQFLYYYRGKDRRKDGSGNPESEIDFILEENGVLYPIEIKMSGNVRADMASAFPILDKVSDKKRGPGAILCRTEYRLKLRDNLYALPIEYL